MGKTFLILFLHACIYKLCHSSIFSHKAGKQYFLYEHMMFSFKLLRMFKLIMHCICLSQVWWKVSWDEMN